MPHLAVAVRSRLTGRSDSRLIAQTLAAEDSTGEGQRSAPRRASRHTPIGGSWLKALGTPNMICTTGFAIGFPGV